MATLTLPGQLQEVLTPSQPLGPAFTEPLLKVRDDVFQLLYDNGNHIHHDAHVQDPPYIVGRKGAGKTAFLAGAPLLADADVVLIESEEIYSAVERLRREHEHGGGAVFTETLVHVWEVLLFHAALLGICRSERLPRDANRQQVWSYMTSFGDPNDLQPDELLALVSAKVSEALRRAAPGTAFRVACQSLDFGRGTFGSAREAARAMLDDFGGRRRLYVVVDNLEDLHRRVDELRDTISSLFRVTTEDMTLPKNERLPFSLRFAFPAELLLQLREIAANPEKDFLGYMTISWTASELIVLAGNRIRFFLDANMPHAAKALKLPKEHDPGDRKAAEKTLRALLPKTVMGGLNQEEDAVAYVMRHTQLLPRHLILNLNEILKACLLRQNRHDALPRATPQDVLTGVRQSELRIVEGILSSYKYQFPNISEALRLLKNRLDTKVSSSQLHKEFNQSGAKAAGMDFDQFLDAAITIGAFGIVGQSTDRYVQAEFAYTYADDLRPVKGKDDFGVHPLFMYRLFDGRLMKELADRGSLPVYPYGSGADDEVHDL